MEDTSFIKFWKFYWTEFNLLGKLFLIVGFPYLWITYALANSGYSNENEE